MPAQLVEVFLLRGLAAASLTALPLIVSAPAHAAETLPLSEAVAGLPLGTESRTGTPSVTGTPAPTPLTAATRVPRS